MKNLPNLVALAFSIGLGFYAFYLTNADDVRAVTQGVKNRIALASRSSSDFAEPRESSGYTVIVSCGIGGQHYNILACFTDTELEVVRNDIGHIYRAYELRGLGTEQPDGLHFPVPEHFAISAQNSAQVLVLGVTIRNARGAVVYSREAGQYGTIVVGN